jgi:predicted transcriptional regulator
MRHKREYIEVIADILRLGQMGRTQMMYDARLSYSQLRKYLDFLTERGLMTWVDEEKIYRTTEKGFRLLETIDRMQALLSPDPAVQEDNKWAKPAGYPRKREGHYGRGYMEANRKNTR